MNGSHRDLPRWHDIADAIFRRRILIVCSTLLLVAAVAVTWKLTGGKYEAQMVLLVRNNRAEVIVTPGQTPNNIAQGGMNEGQIATEVQLLMNRSSLRQIAQRGLLEENAAEDSSAKQYLRVAERDLRYFHAQLERAEPVAPAALADPAAQADEVHFGASVTLVGDDGEQRRVRIVGDDEADAAVGDISWASPLARALIGARVGEIVSCHRPAGATEIEILAIHYAQS